MYGKLFESCFTGSMMGSGSNVFAIWAYIISNAKEGQIELNPKHLAVLIGMSVKEVEDVINFLCEPDPYSRSKKEDGRRLIKNGQFQYEVVNFKEYHNIRKAEERREYFKNKKREYRSCTQNNNGIVDSQQVSTDVQRSPHVHLSYTESYTDTDTINTSSNEEGFCEDQVKIIYDETPQPKQPKKRKVDTESSYLASFAIFYDAYPKKQAKADARKAWLKLKPDQALLDEILSKLEIFKASTNWNKDNGQYIPLPASWLNKRRWEDELITQHRQATATQYQELA